MNSRGPTILAIGLAALVALLSGLQALPAVAGPGGGSRRPMDEGPNDWVNIHDLSPGSGGLGMLGATSVEPQVRPLRLDQVDPAIRAGIEAWRHAAISLATVQRSCCPDAITAQNPALELDDPTMGLSLDPDPPVFDLQVGCGAPARHRDRVFEGTIWTAHLRYLPTDRAPDLRWKLEPDAPEETGCETFVEFPWASDSEISAFRLGALCHDPNREGVSGRATMVVALDAADLGGPSRLEPAHCGFGLEAVPGSCGHCCWPGQTWDGGCDGTPTSCPQAMHVEGDACVVEEIDTAAPDPVPDAMAWIPGGPFRMGCSAPVEGEACQRSAEPARSVWVDGFFIDLGEVTVREYGRCVDAGDCTGLERGRIPETAWNWGWPGREDHPVNAVTWEQADVYCRWVGKRLPTEAEWEKAARGVDGRAYPWGEDSPSCDHVRARLGGDCEVRSTAPGGAAAQGTSPYGAHDMAGNVAEWAADWMGRGGYSELPEVNPQGVDEGEQRVLRGGGYDSTKGARSSLFTWARSSAPPDAAWSSIGFRCAVGEDRSR